MNSWLLSVWWTVGFLTATTHSGLSVHCCSNTDFSSFFIQWEAVPVVGEVKEELIPSLGLELALKHFSVGLALLHLHFLPLVCCLSITAPSVCLWANPVVFLRPQSSLGLYPRFSLSPQILTLHKSSPPSHWKPHIAFFSFSLLQSFLKGQSEFGGFPNLTVSGVIPLLTLSSPLLSE